jgi:2-polyprenyl-3-methyl-5-hydroxy-6-metoxy-1,4-benzoquinol methylase
MKLYDRTDITRLLSDGVTVVPLNELQQKERDKYFQYIASGTYTLQQYTACPICGCNHGTIVAKKDRYGIAQTTVVCRDCGVIYTQDPLDETSLANFYRDQYRRLYEGHEQTSAHKERYHEKRFLDRTSYADIFLKQCALVTTLPKTGTVVEIGCGGGWNLSGFPAKGWTAIGYDYDVDEMEFGKRRGLDLRDGSIEKAVSDGVKADILLMIHFLEHSSDPIETLRNAAMLLNPNGVLFISVPGLKSMIFGEWGDRLAKTLQNAHLFLFELRTLDLVASKAGFIRLWGIECCSAIFRLNPRKDFVTTLDSKPRGDNVLRYIALLELSALLWSIIWRICGGPETKASFFVKRTVAAIVRRIGFNI